MTIAKKITITTESHEVYVLRVNGNPDLSGFCNKCSAEVGLLTLDQAVSLSRLSTIEIVNRVETGDVHFWETATGHLFLCQESLKSGIRKAEENSNQMLELR